MDTQQKGLLFGLIAVMVLIVLSVLGIAVFSYF
jgi:hypothetical protein